MANKIKKQIFKTKIIRRKVKGFTTPNPPLPVLTPVKEIDYGFKGD